MTRLFWKRLKRRIRGVTGWDGFGWIAGIAFILAIGVVLSWWFWEELRGDEESLSTTVRNLGFVIGGVIATVLAICMFKCVARWDGFWWIAGVAFILAIGIILSCRFWEELRGDGESLSTTVRDLGFVIGGIIAIVLAVWRSVVAERQADTARRQSETAERGLLNERYQKGAEMLGSDLLSVRLGGIYALQHLAEDHPGQYHIQIMRLFCAFARYPTEEDGCESHLNGEEHPPLREDVQAVMTAIGGRKEAGLEYEKTGGFRLDLHGADFHGLGLYKANLSGASLRGATLGHATLLSADLSDADLISADLTDAKFGGANLSEAELTDAKLARAKLDGANLSQTTLYRASLSQVSAQKTDFSQANLASTNLTNANLENADLSRTIIRSADLSRATLWKTNLSGAFIGKSLRPNPSEPEAAFTRVTQAQLDQATADPHNPPKIDCGTVDIETGKPLVWHERPPGRR